MPQDNIRIVEQFVAAWNARDPAGIMSFLTADCVYHNIPMQPLAGTAAIRAAVDRILATYDEIDFVNHAVAQTADGKVLTERSDRFRMGEKHVDLPVMGIFELRDGKISAWRDYFDVEMWQKQLRG